MNGDHSLSRQKEVFYLSDHIQNSMRKSFCLWYVLLGSVPEAAVHAGADRENAFAFGMQLLKKPACKKYIAELRAALADENNVITGLRRLAFGSCNDAIYLAFAEELPPPSVIASLDLFNVAEIKRIKDKGVEIKFADRMKALEKLYELENSFSDNARAESLIGALTASAEESAADGD